MNIRNVLLTIIRAGTSFCVFLSAFGLFTQDTFVLAAPLPSISFTSQDRVLVVAPHPDDETIGAGGVIQQALKAGARVRVCLLTNGENNEFAFIVYERRIVMKPKEFIRLGKVRHQESLDATRLFGLGQEDTVSLGYPDYGTMDVLSKYWGDTKAFRSMLSRARKVPYADTLAPDSPYVGESVLRDMKRVLGDFKPTKVFVSHPADINRDHRAAYLFTRVALWDLEYEGLISTPGIFPYIVHIPDWPVPRGYHPELPLLIPPTLENVGINWIVQPLDLMEIGRKYDAVLEYPSQIKYAPRYLVSFVRSNELFGDFPIVPLERQMVSDPEIAWSVVGVSAPQKRRIKSDATNHFSEVAYARQGNYIVARVTLRRVMDKEFGLTLSLMGYNSQVPFAEMPKIDLVVGRDGFRIKDKKKTVYSKEVLFFQKDKELVFKIPLSFLGDPQRILSTVKTAVYDLTLDQTAWRVLELQ